MSFFIHITPIAVLPLNGKQSIGPWWDRRANSQGIGIEVEISGPIQESMMLFIVCK